MTPRRGLPLWVWLAAAGGLGFAGTAAAGGLRCSVGEVVIENLKIGQTYSLRSLANLPLSVTSTCDGAVLVRIAPMIPDTSELKMGAEAIPALEWAAAVPETLALAPGQTGVADLMLRIPDDERLFGRKFQAVFWSHTLPRPGELLAYGLKSRVIFSIDTTRADPGEPATTGDVGIELTPGSVKLDGVVRGKPSSLTDRAGHGLQVRNTSTKPVTVEISTLSAAAAGVPMERGCTELLDSATMSLTPERITLGPGESREITGTVQLAPAKGGLRGDLMCVVSATVVDQPVRTRIFSRVYASLR